MSLLIALVWIVRYVGALAGRIMIVDGAYLVEMVAEKNRELTCEFCGSIVEPPIGDEMLFCQCGAEYGIGLAESGNGHKRRIVYNYDFEKRCVVEGFSEMITKEFPQSGLVSVTFLRVGMGLYRQSWMRLSIHLKK